MNTRRISLLMVLLSLVVVLLSMGGCSRHYVDVYFNESCSLVTLENDDEVDPLIVYKGDYVVFNSLRETRTTTLELPAGMFEVDKVEIKPLGRAILKVIDGGIKSGEIIFSGDGCESGDPDVKIGEGP